MGYRVCSALRGAVGYPFSELVLKGHGTLLKLSVLLDHAVYKQSKAL